MQWKISPYISQYLLSFYGFFIWEIAQCQFNRECFCYLARVMVMRKPLFGLQSVDCGVRYWWKFWNFLEIWMKSEM